MTQPAYNPLRIPTPPTFASMEEARRHRKERLTASMRLFAKFGFDEGFGPLMFVIAAKNAGVRRIIEGRRGCPPSC